MKNQKGINWPFFIILICDMEIAFVQDLYAPVNCESTTYRFEFDNDFFFKKDNKISSGLSLQKHSAVAGSWEDLQGVPEFVRLWGETIPTLTDGGMIYRAGIAIGQVIQTPSDLSSIDLIKDDVPMPGCLLCRRHGMFTTTSNFAVLRSQLEL